MPVHHLVDSFLILLANFDRMFGIHCPPIIVAITRTLIVILFANSLDYNFNRLLSALLYALRY